MTCQRTLLVAEDSGENRNLRMKFPAIDSLELRRLRYDLVFVRVYKMPRFFGLADLNSSDYLTLRVSSIQLIVMTKIVFKQFATERIVIVGN